MKITELEFNKLYDENISKKEYDSLIGKIRNRINEILITLIPSLKKRGWWDYGNCDCDSEKSNGYFDAHLYRENIEIAGENCRLPLSAFYNCDNSFPTRWLWEDTFKEESDNEMKLAQEKKAAEKQAAKQKREAKKEQRAIMKEIIKQKLTKEELKFVVFKK
jgi:hypothetical protein